MDRARIANTISLLRYRENVRDDVAALILGDMPRAVAQLLRREIARGDAQARALEQHYLELMPRMRRAQLDGSDATATTFFAAQLRWDALPRLARAVANLFALLPADATLLGARSLDELRARSCTVGEFFAQTCYGGFMPLLYGYSADLQHFARSLARDSLDSVIDRYLAAPLIHELTHFSRARDVPSLYLDECVAAWLGVRVMPEFALPAPGQDNGLYATPWFAQVGQALARVAGVERVVAAQAGALPWPEALPRGLADALARLGDEDFRATRPMHLLSDTYAPARWMKLCFLAASGVSVDTITLGELEALPWSAIAPGDEHDEDRAIVRDGLRAMCLRNFHVECPAGKSFRTGSRPAPAPITIDLEDCKLTAPPAPDGCDTVAPAYLFPPAVAARIARDRPARFDVRVHSLDEIETLADAIIAGKA
jgi:hypothetical protein